MRRGHPLRAQKYAPGTTTAARSWFFRVLTPCCHVNPVRRSDGAVPEGADGEGRMPGVAAPHPGGNLLQCRRLRQRAWGMLFFASLSPSFGFQRIVAIAHW